MCRAETPCYKPKYFYIILLHSCKNTLKTTAQCVNPMVYYFTYKCRGVITQLQNALGGQDASSCPHLLLSSGWWGYEGPFFVFLRNVVCGLKLWGACQSDGCTKNDKWEEDTAAPWGGWPRTQWGGLIVCSVQPTRGCAVLKWWSSCRTDGSNFRAHSYSYHEAVNEWQQSLRCESSAEKMLFLFFFLVILFAFLCLDIKCNVIKIDLHMACTVLSEQRVISCKEII